MAAAEVSIQGSTSSWPWAWYSRGLDQTFQLVGGDDVGLADRGHVPDAGLLGVVKQAQRCRLGRVGALHDRQQITDDARRDRRGFGLAILCAWLLGAVGRALGDIVEAIPYVIVWGGQDWLNGRSSGRRPGMTPSALVPLRVLVAVASWPAICAVLRPLRAPVLLCSTSRCS